MKKEEEGERDWRDADDSDVDECDGDGGDDAQLDDEEASQPARAASPDPPEYTTARAPDPVPRVVVGGGPSPRKSAPRPLTPPRSEALGDADLDDLAAAQAQLDAILGAPPAYVASRQ